MLVKSLPHNFLAEKMLLNCLIHNFQAVEITVQTIPIEAFYFKTHQEIYKIIIKLYKKKVSIDILSITIFLQENGLLKTIGGIEILLEFTNQIPNIVYLNDYICLVKDKFFRRCLIKFGYRIINSGYITNLPLEIIIESLENEFVTILSKIRILRTLTSAQILNNVFSELKSKFLNPKLPGLSSGFHDLDLLTQGFQREDLIIIAGRPSMGKTALSLNIALNIIKKNQLPVLIFSLEMSNEQIMYRILSSETRINQRRLKNGKLYKNDWIKLTKIIKFLSRFPLFIDDTPNLTIQNIYSTIKIIISQQTKLGLIIIDYLQLMEISNTKNITRAQELSQITRSLKNLAREFNIPIIVLSQLSRNVENRVDQKPILSDLRESGSIEQDADLVLMLYREKLAQAKFNLKEKLNVVKLSVAKQRNGPIGDLKLLFNENQAKFTDVQINKNN